MNIYNQITNKIGKMNNYTMRKIVWDRLLYKFMFVSPICRWAEIKGKKHKIRLTLSSIYNSKETSKEGVTKSALHKGEYDEI